MKTSFSRFETGILVMVAVLFLYAPAADSAKFEEAPELRFRTLELVQEITEWFETAFSRA